MKRIVLAGIATVALMAGCAMPDFKKAGYLWGSEENIVGREIRKAYEEQLAAEKQAREQAAFEAAMAVYLREAGLAEEKESNEDLVRRVLESVASGGAAPAPPAPPEDPEPLPPDDTVLTEPPEAVNFDVTAEAAIETRGTDLTLMNVAGWTESFLYLDSGTHAVRVFPIGTGLTEDAVPWRHVAAEFKAETDVALETGQEIQAFIADHELRERTADTPVVVPSLEPPSRE